MKSLLAIWLFFTAMVSLSAQEVRRALPAVPAESFSADDLAKFLAGVPVPPGSPLFEIRHSSGYAGHVAALAHLSQRYDRNFFSKMRTWSAEELAPRIPMDRPLYYFFSGPDAVSPLALYPDAPVYILGGLESVGSIQAPNTLSPEALAEALANLRRSAEVILSFGFFITKDMKVELDRTAFRGVLPLIYTFIAFAGGEVVSSDYIGIDGEGTLLEIGDISSGRRGFLPGVRIKFRRGGHSTVQTLYYVQANVADDVLRAKGELLRWAGSFGLGNVYLKAASYLLHESGFSRIRAFLLGQALSVLQDDSGIPFRFFRNEGWRCWFFGNYSGTLDIFAKHYQSDLSAAFAAPGMAVPLPFGTGYKWRPGESNLLLAVKQAASRPDPTSAR